MVVVVMILVAWVVILGPSMIRRRARAGSQQSIVHFHHQLRILEHSAPEPIVAPAYRLRAVDGTDAPHGISYPGTGQRPVLTVVGAKDLPRPALAFLGEPAPGADEAADHSAAAPAAGPWDVAEVAHRTDGARAALYDHADPDSWVAGPVDHRHPSMLPPVPTEAELAWEAAVRASTRRRRRDALLVLAGAALVSVVAAAASGSAAVWVLAVVALAVLGGYVALLVQLQSRAHEREDKLHFLDHRRDDLRAYARQGSLPPVAGPVSYGPPRDPRRPAPGRTAAR